MLAGLYAYYLHSLAGKLDLSRLQSAALQRLTSYETAGEIFRHVIIDEYQDTNRVQEALFFKLTQATKNLCVVGDDDQALYRFRGATVDNLVRFDERCRTALAIDPTRIDLHVNFRSVPDIVGTYNHFIATHPDLHRDYRLAKTIVPHVVSQGAGVVTSKPGALGSVCVEIAGLVRTLIDQHIVADANQIAFLYPSVKSREAKAMVAALRQQGLAVYAPRSGRFLDGMEAKLIVGLLLQVLDKPGSAADSDSESQFAYFQNWLDACATVARNVLNDDDEQDLAESVDVLRAELDSLQPTGTTDWNLLDLFYRFCAAYRIQGWLNQASEDDEGPACNLALVSQYLSRYQKMRGLSVIRGSDIPRLRQDFFNGYLYGLYRLEQSAYEDEENPFPEGKIPFLTIHQAKGLEFPVVVLGSLKPFTQRTATVETLVRPWARPGAEPEEHLAAFDAMRMFYVALSRAKNLLVLPNIPTAKSHPGLAGLLAQGLGGQPIPLIADLKIEALPRASADHEQHPKTYAYTADYQVYRNCPRQYLLFRKYGFAPARTQTMLFGSLVHKTIEDVHRRLMRDRDDTAGMEAFITQRFQDNYRHLSAMSSHALAPDTQEAGRQQVLAYWQKCGDIARRITDVEVPLTLPDQRTPKNRRFAIHGVVDMVQAGANSRLYDIKTHAAAVVRADPDYYREQLNVYAHIWKEIYRQSLDGISIIATQWPADEQLSGWQPVVDLDFDLDSVATTIHSFGNVVDQIAERQFAPRPPDALHQVLGGGLGVFREEVCDRCDGRHACASYRMTAQPKLDGVAEADIDHAIHTRNGFLSQPTVATFIEWLIAKLNTVTFSLNILPSRYVPHGLQREITGISAIIPDHYRWKSAWTDRRGIRIESECWNTTRHAMAKLRTWLKESLDQDNSEELKQACYAVLEWGGVNRAREFIDKLHMEGRLVDYLRSRILWLWMPVTQFSYDHSWSDTNCRPYPAQCVLISPPE